MTLKYTEEKEEEEEEEHRGSKQQEHWEVKEHWEGENCKNHQRESASNLHQQVRSIGRIMGLRKICPKNKKEPRTMQKKTTTVCASHVHQHGWIVHGTGLVERKS